MNPQIGLAIYSFLSGIGLVFVSGFALYQIPRDKNPLAGADQTTWIYRNIGPQHMKTLMLVVFALLLIYGANSIIRSAIFLIRERRVR